jgi:purine-binding chemotaxis protein CheW
MNTNSQDSQNSESAIRSLVAFRLDRQTYALPIEPIVQIIEMVAITPIPQVNPAVEGVINVRGTAVPVVNLRCQLGLPEAKLQLHTPIILVQTGERMVGLIVDQVADVLNIRADQITRPKDMLPDGLSDVPLVQGLTHTAQGALLLLDLEHLLASNQAQLAQALEALSAINDSSEDDQPEPAETASAEAAGAEATGAEAAGADEFDLSEDGKKEPAETASADKPEEAQT